MRYSNINNRGGTGSRPSSNQKILNSNNYYEENKDLDKSISLREAHNLSNSRLNVSRANPREEERDKRLATRYTVKKLNSSNSSSNQRTSSAVSRANPREEERYEDLEKEEIREIRDTGKKTNRSNRSSNQRTSSAVSRANLREEEIASSNRISSRAIDSYSKEYPEEDLEKNYEDNVRDENHSVALPTTTKVSEDPYDKYRTVSKRLKKEKVEQEAEEGINSYKQVHQEAEEAKSKQGFFKKVFSRKK